MGRLLSFRSPMPLSYANLAQHCDFCHAAAQLIYRECTPREHGALTILMLTHQQNERERQDFYARYLNFLYGSTRFELPD